MSKLIKNGSNASDDRASLPDVLFHAAVETAGVVG
jgi:hypothetical protein